MKNEMAIADNRGLDQFFLSDPKFDNEQELQEKAKEKPLEQIENYLNSIIMDDKELVQRILRTGFSAYTNNPINLGIMAPTSEGKTYAVVEVMKLFPKENVMFLAGMSPTALIHDKGILREDKIVIDLTGKILVFLDAPHIELWDRLKPILSHDNEEVEFKITDKSGKGQLKTKNVIIHGWPSCIFCSARNEKHSRIWDEIETRFLITSPNTDAMKYKKANNFTSIKYGLPDFAQNIVQNEENEKQAKYAVKEIMSQIQALSMGKKTPVWNPFYKIISDFLPSNEGAAMRSAKRFFTLCNIETLINFDENYRLLFQKQNNEKEQYLITSLHDIENIITIMGSSSVIPAEKLKFVSDVLEPSLKGIDEGVTTAILAEKYKQVYQKETTPKKILETFLKPLCSYGIVDYKENPTDKRQHLYRIVSSPNAKPLDYIKSKIIEESNNNTLFIELAIKELENCSIDKGHIECIMDSNGTSVDRNILQSKLLETNSKSNIS